MLLLINLCGLRVGEVATLKIDGVVDTNGNVLDEITLSAQVTKNNQARKVLLPKKMQNHLQEYLSAVRRVPTHGYIRYNRKAVNPT